MKFSVIIPLEFNRGLAVRCIRTWVESQSLPRDDYEILVAASETHSPEELNIIQELLLPQDKLVRFPVSHDMDLVAAAAGLALGDVMVFTESHCLPETNFLELSKSVLNEHPEWGGFSGRSIPLTHNLLSIIESELYEKDITFNLTQHDWLKVLDQCFIIRSKDYFSVGGIEPSYGHFSEWHLAARFHLKGIKIGYAPQVKVGHYYIGDMDDLETFTLDFIKGEMRCASQADTDSCSHLFEPPPEWKSRSRWNKALVTALYEPLKSSQQISFRHSFRYLALKSYSLKPAIALNRWLLTLIHWLLDGLLFIRWKSASKVLFKRWIITCVHLGRLIFLQEFYRNSAITSTPLPITVNEWTPTDAIRWENIGFHELEHFKNSPFRWSEPVGCIRLPINKGTWKITIHMLSNFPLTLGLAPKFFANGRPILASKINQSETYIEMLYSHSENEFLYLTWISKRLSAPKDKRELGLPITKIQWHDIHCA